MTSSKYNALRARLDLLEGELANGGGPLLPSFRAGVGAGAGAARRAAAAPAAAPAERPRWQAAGNAKKGAACSDDTVTGLLKRLRRSEAAWTAEKAALQLQLKHERQRGARAEAAARRAEDQRDFRASEAEHLRAALQRRDGEAAELRARLRALDDAAGAEVAGAVARVEAERDELLVEAERLRERLAEVGADVKAVRGEAAAADAAAAEADRARAEALRRASGAEAEAAALAAELGRERAARAAAARAAEVADWHTAHRVTAMRQLVALGEALPSVGGGAASRPSSAAGGSTVLGTPHAAHAGY
jgi:hypothetical protein